MYGFFSKELIHLIALTRLTSLLFLPAFVCRLPRPTPVADRSVTRLSPCLQYYSAVRLLVLRKPRNDTVVLPLRVLDGDFVDLAPADAAHDHQSDCGGIY